jgi:hypothetical protein
MTTATMRSLPSKTSSSSPFTSRPISVTRLTSNGSLRTTFITWSSWYQRTMRGFLAARNGRFGLWGLAQMSRSPPCS